MKLRIWRAGKRRLGSIHLMSSSKRVHDFNITMAAVPKGEVETKEIGGICSRATKIEALKAMAEKGENSQLGLGLKIQCSDLVKVVDISESFKICERVGFRQEVS